MDRRFPQEIVAVKNAAISIFSFPEKFLGTCIGSVSIKKGWLYLSTFSSRKDFKSGKESLVIGHQSLVISHCFILAVAFPHLFVFNALSNSKPSGAFKRNPEDSDVYRI